MSACLLAASCAGTGTDTMSDEASSPPATPVPTPRPVIERYEIPASPAGEQLAWLVGTIGGEVPDEAELDARFAASFLDAVPPDEISVVLGQVSAGLGRGPELVDLAVLTDFFIVGRLEGDDQAQAEFVLGVTAASPHQIRTLALAPPGDPGDSAPAVERWDELAPAGSILVADVVDGACQPTASDGAFDTFAIGSLFKIYVAGALSDAVGDGELDWSDPVQIADELRSLPSGILQDEPTGTTLSALQSAELMLGISDNTATDHLIDLVGREAVEQALTDLGHRRPALTTPLLQTAELFKLRATNGGQLEQQYALLEPDARRAFLDGPVAATPLPPVDEVFSSGQPGAIESSEWFASPMDICMAFAGLLDRVEAGDDDLDRVLRASSGGDDLRGEWDRVWFKGGSEPGVLSLAWLLQRGDAVTVVVGMLNDADNPIDEVRAAEIAAVLIDSLS